MSDGSRHTPGAVGVAIATIALQHEHDLIVLRRRLRTAADEQNFDRRDISRLSAAAYEAARQLYSAHGSTTSELRVSRDCRRALRAGFRHFVPKPVEIDELAAVVRTVADQR